ncbi:MAG: cyclopropane-fatty-acyl-phospholipid synthase family protein [Pseudomonadota bacterium]
MWDRLLDAFGRNSVRIGILNVTLPDGRQFTYGDGTGSPVSMTIHDQDTLRRIVLDPDMGMGEGYMNGRVTFENDDVSGFLALASLNMADGGMGSFQRPLEALRKMRGWWRQMNSAASARANVAHHYDLSAGLYELFLDEDKQYSCAYFREPDLTLDAAQAAKKHHIASKLLIEPDMRVLDIGCGWGGMALTLARDFGARVVGVTLSEEQLRIARARAEAAGLADRVEFQLLDYRKVNETFDRVVSVGMFEHVGRPHYCDYFRSVRSRLAPDGVALIHTIGRTDPPGKTSTWIDKYIFPGGYIPSMSETLAAVEKEGLYSCDIEVWRLHYAETIRHWYNRFMERIDEAEALYDARFCRMWRYYLLASEMTFRYNNQCVFQFQLSIDQEAVPLTRDYLYMPPEAQRAALAAE